jgi:uncharacterized membrane protein affecting hemolysin expression
VTVSQTSVNITETATEQTVPLILIACIVIGLIGLLMGLLWLRQRRARREAGHLHADIAKKESLADEERRR